MSVKSLQELEDQEIYTKDYLEDKLLNDELINQLRETKSNAAWRRIIKTEIL
ncbi:hypothetical protein MHM83_11025 [Tenacibaculum sp. Mcav3-52]|uniref:hypothetical protein n=1 Tax=Tenacibaculum sp. Mcav3-52 TaxID=2917762 RepID=UPI001EF27DB1|nr:hypothetical protein [Tenacibaculum sp. Mcav3-52]MCG7502405.1 hypothetical protein [Tenacibaculum sp. Mcav3-52]